MSNERRRPARPGGEPPPQSMRLPDGSAVDLGPLVREITDRYLAAFPDELDRYADPGVVREWSEHDNRHLLNWAAQHVSGRLTDFQHQIAWLGGVLEARDFPLPRYAADLAIAAEVVDSRLGRPGEAIAVSLREGAEMVRARGSFLSAPPDQPAPG